MQLTGNITLLSPSMRYGKTGRFGVDYRGWIAANRGAEMPYIGDHAKANLTKEEDAGAKSDRVLK